PTPPAAVMRSVWLLIGVVAASAIGVLWHLARSSPPGGEGLFPAVTEFLTSIADPAGGVQSAQLVEGLAVFGVAILVFGAAPRTARDVPATLAVSAAIAVIVGLALWMGLAPESALKTYARTGYRIGVPVGDENAAGSYFLLVLG